MPASNNLGGLSGLTPAAQPLLVDYNAQPEATAEDRLGGPVNPAHAQVGEQAQPYSWESKQVQAGGHGPYGLENQLLDDPDAWDFLGAGTISDDPTGDKTPFITGAGPFPQGILSGPVDGVSPDAVADMRQKSADIHGIKTQAGFKSIYPNQAISIQNDEWTDFYNVEVGSTLLEPVNRQQQSNSFLFGTRDRTVSMARQNEYGFDASHHHRRYAVGSIPGNTFWMRPGGRPMAKSLAGPARLPVGTDSPFEGDNVGASWAQLGAVLQQTPTEYAPPPIPATVPFQYPSDNGSVDPAGEWQ